MFLAYTKLQKLSHWKIQLIINYEKIGKFGEILKNWKTEFLYKFLNLDFFFFILLYFFHSSIIFENSRLLFSRFSIYFIVLDKILELFPLNFRMKTSNENFCIFYIYQANIKNSIHFSKRKSTLNLNSLYNLFLLVNLIKKMFSISINSTSFAFEEYLFLLKQLKIKSKICLE